MNSNEFEIFNANKDFKKINKLLSSNFNQIIDYLKDFNDNDINSDIYIYEVYGKDIFYFFKFLIKSFRNDIECIFNNKFQVFKIIHSNYIDSKKIFFHASDYNSWHSIVRNNLVNLSSTKMMKNGKAHGNGIYFSSNFNFVTIYSKTIKKIVGVYSCNCNYEKYKKNNNIYVFPNTNNLQLLYLIKFDNNYKTNIINKYIEKNIIGREQNYLINRYIPKKITKRIMKEYNDMKKFYNVDIISVNEWMVNIDNIKINIIFNEKYPIIPPFIFIKNKIKNGSLCIEYLSKNNWTPSISILNLILLIDFNIIKNINKINIIDGDNDYKNAINEFGSLCMKENWLN